MMATATKAAPKTARKKATATGPKTPVAVASKSGRTGRTPRPRGTEVSYSSHLFRSQLEARWAIFFDLMGINWDYEPSFYQVGPMLRYLPDIYLPDLQIWVEVKGVPFFDAESYAKCLASVGGPMPIPVREPPYGAAQMLMLVGDARNQMGIEEDGHMRPIHTCIVPGQNENEADLYQGFFDLPSVGAQTQVTLSDEPYVTLPATGVKATRRPSVETTAAMLGPRSTRLTGVGPSDRHVLRSYRAAAKAHFTKGGKAELDMASLDAADRKLLALRRGGRPLGVGR